MPVRPTRRSVVTSLLTLPILGRAAPAWSSTSEPYPSKTIRIIVPFLAGGAADIVARVVAENLSRMLGQPVICDNRPGAGSNIGTEQAAKSPADGYTLLIQGNPLGSNQFLYKTIGYDPLKSFAPIAMHYRDFNILIVHPTFPANSVKDIIALAKQKPGELTFASSGNGTSTHLAGELFNQMAGTKIVHVPYRGVPPAVTDVMGQQVNMMFAGYGVVSGLIKDGKLKGLAVTGSHRLKQAPDVPTVAETLPGFDATTWTGLFAPAGTPEPIIKQLNAAVNEILQRPEIRHDLEKRGFITEIFTPERVMQEVMRDIRVYGDVIRKTGATLQ